jgi:hypothetical protein
MWNMVLPVVNKLKPTLMFTEAVMPLFPRVAKIRCMLTDARISELCAADKKKLRYYTLLRLGPVLESGPRGSAIRMFLFCCKHNYVELAKWLHLRICLMPNESSREQIARVAEWLAARYSATFPATGVADAPVQASADDHKHVMVVAKWLGEVKATSLVPHPRREFACILDECRWLTKHFLSLVNDPQAAAPVIDFRYIPSNIRRVHGNWIARSLAAADPEAFGACGFLECCARGHHELARWLARICDVSGAVEAALSASCKEDHLEIAAWLVDSFHALRTTCKPMPIFWGCCEMGHLDAAKWIATKFDIVPAQVTGCGELNPFFFQCERGYVETATWLVETFAGDPSRNDNFRADMFMAAAKQAAKLGHADVLQDFLAKLLQTRIWPSHVQQWETMGEYFEDSCENGHLDVAKWLCAKHKSMLDGHLASAAFAIACGNGHMEIAKWLAETFSGVPRIHATWGLWQACEHGHMGIVRWLTQTFPLVYSGSTSRDVCIAIKRCCEHGHLEIAQWLLEYFKKEKLKLAFGDEDNHSACYWFEICCINGLTRVVQWLTETFGLREWSVPAK